MGSISTSSISGVDLKTSFVPGSWRPYTCYRSWRDRLGTQAPPALDGFPLRRRSGSAAHRCGQRLEANQEGSQRWGAVGAGPAHVYAGDTQ